MKILMPGLCKQACASLVSACLLVGSTPLSAYPDDRLTSHTSGNLHETATVHPLLSRPAAHSSSEAASTNLAQGERSVAKAGAGEAFASQQVVAKAGQVSAKRQPGGRRLTKAQFPASQGSKPMMVGECLSSSAYQEFRHDAALS